MIHRNSFPASFSFLSPFPLFPSPVLGEFLQFYSPKNSNLLGFELAFFTLLSSVSTNVNYR